MRLREPSDGKNELTGNQRIAIRVFVLWAGVMIVVLCTILAVRSCAIRTGQAFVGAAGPGNSDYEMNILGDFSLFRRSKNARSIVSKSARNTWIGEDLVRLGWDARFIVCLQNSDWWIIDSVEKAKYGPFDELGCSAKLRELGVEPPQAYPTPEGRGSPVYFGPGELHRRELE